MYNIAALARSNRFVRLVKRIIALLLSVLQLIFGLIYFVLCHILEEINATEEVFMMMTNLYALTCQLFFFSLCDITLLSAEHKHERGKIVSSLTTLLLYTIFTYFVSKIKETFSQSGESTNIFNTRNNIVRFLKILLEFAKATIAILCLHEQGLNYHFDPLYSPITFIYYICTEKLLIDTTIFLTKLFDFARFDGLEHLYVPIFLHICSVALSTAIIGYIFTMGVELMFTAITSYFTIYLKLKDLKWNYLNPLILEQRTFASFRIADESDLAKWDDICAVCLEKMSRARITPCNHLFHPQCLKRCLQTSMQCPLCKEDFI